MKIIFTFALLLAPMVASSATPFKAQVCSADLQFLNSMEFGEISLFFGGTGPTPAKIVLLIRNENGSRQIRENPVLVSASSVGLAAGFYLRPYTRLPIRNVDGTPFNQLLGRYCGVKLGTEYLVGGRAMMLMNSAGVIIPSAAMTTGLGLDLSATCINVAAKDVMDEMDNTILQKVSCE